MRCSTVAILISAVLLSAIPASAQSRQTSAGAPPGAMREKEALAAALEELRSIVTEQARELEAQRKLLREQEERVVRLEAQLAQGSVTTGSPADTGSQPALNAQVPVVDRLNKLEADVAAANQATENKLKGLGNFRFSGDVRIRYEPFFQDGAANRHRQRARARLHLTGNLTDEIFGGVSLVSGSPEDVNSSNQTFTGFLTRKPVNLDRYYITYQPKAAGFLTLTGGKFATPWVRTALTFDSDINPEGLAQTFSFDFPGRGLKNLTIVGFQLPINESSSGNDSYILGGQVQTHWQLAEHWEIGLHAAGINFKNADPIAVAIARGDIRPSLNNSNTFRTDSTGAVVGYASKFAYLDLIAQVRYSRSPRWPAELTFDFVNNTRAATRERSGYWAELLIGRLAQVRDWQFGYTFVRIEKDAVVGAFNESDLRASTNLLNHKFDLTYQVLKNVQLSHSLFVGRLFNSQDDLSLVPAGLRQPGRPCATSPFTGCKDSFLKRLQLDLIYKF